jgi:hypothetical protein
VKRLAISASLVLALLLCLPATAQAAVRAKTECSDGVCMTVYRDGTYVRNIVPEVLVPPLQKKFGHTETRGPDGFHHNTPDRWYQNVSGTAFSSQASWLAYSFGRNYPKGSLFCTQFWHKIGGKYHSSGDECVKL